MVFRVLEDNWLDHRLIYEKGVWWGGENLPPPMLDRMVTQHQGGCTALYRGEQRRYTWRLE